MADTHHALLLRRAEDLARHAHQGQRDKAGHPYIEHVARVAAGVEHPLDKAVAWLHDVIEDTELTREQLVATGADFSVEQMMVWRALIADVALLTKVNGMSNEDYYARVKLSPRARRVKLSDVKDNADPDRLAVLDEATRERLAAKYAKALAALK